MFIAGIGDPAQPSLIQVPDEQGGLRTLKDSQGNIVKSPLNERGLSALAQKTGGIYVRSTTTDPGLKELEARIQKLAKQEIDSGKQTRPIERPVYPLAGAFLLLCVWFCLSEKRMNGTAAKTMLLLPRRMPSSRTVRKRRSRRLPCRRKKEWTGMRLLLIFTMTV